ncbi:carboxymuconolactone decarboxylase family protein [Paraburkholderia sp. LEh10]|uniref:carboxymuconolactone decarboxylase family protein n=1 Tax=Paraburkholderia sp. LEh10 TaxID=2821353 RepID=UPI001AE8E751|nr:carboxymuconolactone decarboxylase family protein [Paraburkholderia sp. LEh10]MBP0589702.1 carboxymuconolactone decarboxylase family protein [Paraburkholderia sp. LEh10]
MNAPRLPWTTLAPAQYKSMYGVNQALAKSSLGSNLIELVQTRVSQINGCAFCLDMHARELRKGGETWHRLNVLSAWQETNLFTAKEKAALAWAETLTRLPDGYSEREIEYQALREHFSDEEIVELTWSVAVINAWNRMAISMHQPVDTNPID